MKKNNIGKFCKDCGREGATQKVNVSGDTNRRRQKVEHLCTDCKRARSRNGESVVGGVSREKKYRDLRQG